MRIWTLYVDAGTDTIDRSVFESEEDALDNLIANFCEDEGVSREDVVEYLTEKQGVVLYLDGWDLEKIPAGGSHE